jgi:hypothetical protein
MVKKRQYMDNEINGLSWKKKLDPEEFYYTKEGYIVFTEKYLLKRGYCCKNGCKHCPYGYNLKKGTFEKI